MKPDRSRHIDQIFQALDRDSRERQAFVDQSLGQARKACSLSRPKRRQAGQASPARLLVTL